MKKIIFAVMATGLSMLSADAQNNIYGRTPTVQDSTELYYKKRDKTMRLQDLEGERKRIEDSEKFRLKQTIDAINTRLEKNEITAEEAKKQKEEAAKNTALNIDQKIAIVENQIKLAERENYWTFEYERGSAIELGLGNAYDDNGSALLGIKYENRRKDVKYDKRTYGDIVVAGGLSNTFSADRSLKDSPFKIMKSGFAELGYTLRTRLMKDNNFLRLAYGASFQIHSFEANGNRFFEMSGNKQTILTPAPEDLKMQKFRVTNFVFPVYLEFGNSKKHELYDRVRYNTVNNWKGGIGGFAGMNVWNKQFLRYYENNVKVESTETRSFNVSNFVYGVGGYVGYGPISLYASYQLNPLFKNNTIQENVFSLALRIDL